jgi:hypothetical protein
LDGKIEKGVILTKYWAAGSRQQAGVNVNYKSQNSNNKQITMTEIQNSKR